jgi:hypothetical protein
VFWSDLLGSEFAGLFLCQHDHDPSVSAESLEHLSSPPVVLLVYGLPADAQRFSDGLPTPTLFAGVGHMYCFQTLLEPLECANSAQPDRGVSTSRIVGGAGQRFQVGHDVNLY